MFVEDEKPLVFMCIRFILLNSLNKGSFIILTISSNNEK